MQNFPMPLENVHDRRPGPRYLRHPLVDVRQLIQHLFDLERERFEDMIPQQRRSVRCTTGIERTAAGPDLVERNQLEVDVILQVTGLLPKSCKNNKYSKSFVITFSIQGEAKV